MRVKGNISQLNISGVIGQLDVDGSISQKNVYGTIAYGDGIPVPIPVLLTAVIENAAPSDLVMTFDIALDETSGLATAIYSVSDRTVSAVDVSGAVVTVTVTVAFVVDQVVTVGYTKPGSNPLKGTDGGEVATFADEAVTNNVESAYSAEYQDVYNAFLSKPSDADAEAQNAYVQVGLDDGWWYERDRRPVYASHASGRDSLLDWLDPTNNAKVATIVNAPTWTQYQGYLGDSATNYINTNFNPSSDGVKFTLDNSGFGCYVRSSPPSLDVAMGGYQPGPNRYVYMTMWDHGSLNSNVKTGFFSSRFYQQLPFRTIERNNATTIDGYVNGSLDANSPVSLASESPVINQDQYSLASNNNGTPTKHADAQIAMEFYGGYIGSVKQLSERNAFHALMTYYGTAV